MSRLRHLAIVVASSVPLLIAGLLGVADGRWTGIVAVLALWLVGIAALASAVWRETVQPLGQLLDDLGSRTGHQARWRLRRLHEELAACADRRTADAELLADLSAALGDGLLVVDPDLRIRLISPAALAFCGWTEVQPGTLLVEVLRDPDVLKAVRGAVAGGAPAPVIVENARGVWEARAFPVRRGGAVVLLTEVSVQRRAGELRRRFVQDLSHELRSPLTVLRTAVEALAGEVDPATADLLVRQVERITRLSEELHELATIESGELELRPEPIDVEQLAASIAADFSALAERAAIHIDVSVPPQLHLVSDRRALARILGNLLDNAIKYNRRGGSVIVSAERAAAGVALTVQDSGQGIPAEEVRAVTQRFYRVERGRTPGEGGLGLGLAIVKHLAHRLGATMDIDSRVDVGTTVRLLIRDLAAGAPG